MLFRSIGTDESGKGDYFGPLVCGAVCADHDLTQRLIALGVCDCKKLSDRKVSALAIEIDQIARQRVAFTILEPEDYNRKYDELKQGARISPTFWLRHTPDASKSWP